MFVGVLWGAWFLTSFVTITSVGLGIIRLMSHNRAIITNDDVSSVDSVFVVAVVDAIAVAGAIVFVDAVVIVDPVVAVAVVFVGPVAVTVDTFVVVFAGDPRGGGRPALRLHHQVSVRRTHGPPVPALAGDFVRHSVGILFVFRRLLC